MRRMTVGLWLVVIGLIASCAPSTVSPQVTTTERPAGSGIGPSLQPFDEGGLKFDYPVAWQESHFPGLQNFDARIATIATVSVPLPCATTGDPSFPTVACEDRFQLTSDRLVVIVSKPSALRFDMRRLPAGSIALTVDGQPGYVQDEGPNSYDGADLVRIWTLSNPVEPAKTVFQITASIRGPDLVPIEGQLAALIASLRYDPPAPASP